MEKLLCLINKTLSFSEEIKLNEERVKEKIKVVAVVAEHLYGLS